MKGYLLSHTSALLAGILLDWIIGDPHSLPHPVRAIGKLILYLEERLLGNAARSDAQRDPKEERRRGTLLWILVILATATVTFALMAAAGRIHPLVCFLVETVLSCYILAAGSLCRESLLVVKALEADGIEAARSALSMIVGRDTAELTRKEVLMAAVETVAENTSDGVIAPLLFMALGGPVLGFVYKAVNTMDSMLGYRNERYEHFGKTAARMDDIFNFLPSRCSALLMILAAFIAALFSDAFDGKRAFRIWIRDRRRHLSPNSAQTESVCAGALGLQMGGTHLYGGIPVEKPTIGDCIREIRKEDVARANILMAVTELLLAGGIAGISVLLMVIL